MPWGFIQDLPISREEYDSIDQAITDDPEGLIVHTASEKDGRIRIVDIWESKDAYQRFERDTLMPALEGVISGPPEGGPPPMDEFEIHNIRGHTKA